MGKLQLQICCPEGKLKKRTAVNPRAEQQSEPRQKKNNYQLGGGGSQLDLRHLGNLGGVVGRDREGVLYFTPANRIVQLMEGRGTPSTMHWSVKGEYQTISLQSAGTGRSKIRTAKEVNV